jgi:hypothetical protein
MADNDLGSKSDKLRETLSERQMVVLSKVLFDGLTQDQVASELGISQQRVNQILAEGKARLAKAGFPPIQKPKKARVLNCHNGYMEKLVEKNGCYGTIKSHGKPDPRRLSDSPDDYSPFN